MKNEEFIWKIFLFSFQHWFNSWNSLSDNKCEYKRGKLKQRILKKARDDTHSACDSQSTLFKFTFSFLGQKIAFKNMNYTLEDFSKYDPPFKSTVF